MDGGARTQLETRIQRLETAVSALLSEYASARARLHDLEDATGRTSEDRISAGERESVGQPTAASDPVTVAPEHEATQAEVERAVRQVESDGSEESDVVEPNAH